MFKYKRMNRAGVSLKFNLSPEMTKAEKYYFKGPTWFIRPFFIPVVVWHAYPLYIFLQYELTIQGTQFDYKVYEHRLSRVFMSDTVLQTMRASVFWSLQLNVKCLRN